MSTIGIVGATGYAGTHITTEALRRGHRVIAVSRTPPQSPADGVEVRSGSIEDAALMSQLFADCDAVIVAVHAIADDKPLLVDLVPSLLALAAEHTARLGIVGGAGSLLTAPGGPRVLDTPEFPEQFKPEASFHADALEALRAAETTADWFYLSPAAEFGAWIPGERTGHYRVGDDVLVVDADGKSIIGGADYAIAIVDELDNPTHHRARFTVAY